VERCRSAGGVIGRSSHALKQNALALQQNELIGRAVQGAACNGDGIKDDSYPRGLSRKYLANRFAPLGISHADVTQKDIETIACKVLASFDRS
jgi:hypothetical protein